MASHAKSRRSGWSLLETITAVSLTTIVFGAALETASRMSGEMSTAVAETDLDRSLRKIVNRVSSELASSGIDEDGVNYVTSHPDDADTELDSITFSQRTALNGDATDWTTPITYRLAESDGEDPDNGVDDDGDFVVDEQALVRVQDGVTSVIADSVTSLTVIRLSGESTITVNVQAARGAGHDCEPLQHDVSTSVTLRNR